MIYYYYNNDILYFVLLHVCLYLDSIWSVYIWSLFTTYIHWYSWSVSWLGCKRCWKGLGHLYKEIYFEFVSLEFFFVSFFRHFEADMTSSAKDIFLTCWLTKVFFWHYWHLIMVLWCMSFKILYIFEILLGIY